MFIMKRKGAISFVVKQIDSKIRGWRRGTSIDPEVLVLQEEENLEVN